MEIFENITARVDGVEMNFCVVDIFRNEVVELLNSKMYLIKLYDIFGGYEVWMSIEHDKNKKILEFFTGKAPLSKFLDKPPKFYVRDKYDGFNFSLTETPTDLLDEIYNLANFYLEPAPALFPYYVKSLLIE